MKMRLFAKILLYIIISPFLLFVYIIILPGAILVEYALEGESPRSVIARFNEFLL